MSKLRLALVAGARPNFMKIAPILHQLDQRPNIETTLIHTGQHYDAKLSDVFFEELGIRSPDISLGVGSGSHAKQTGDVMVAIEKVLLDAAAEGNAVARVVVVGDVNSTLAATLAAAKLGVPVAHVEAGLRSFDRGMPEEINRIVTDSLSDLLLCSEPIAMENLKREGHDPSQLHLVGNVMIDTLLHQVEKARRSDTLERLGLTPQAYGVVTLHRPSNVDAASTLGPILQVLCHVSTQMPLVFPIHPRTRARIAEFGLQPLLDSAPGMRVLEPLGYLDFLALTSQCKLVVTDSGGLQEETTALGVPCLTMRANTERPITCDEGTGTLVGNSSEMLQSRLNEVLAGNYKVGTCPALWDGQAAIRITDILAGV